MIKKIYEPHIFYGYRKIHDKLLRMGTKCNIKKVRRLMMELGIKGVCPHKNTSIKNQAHKTYPYLLKGLIINRRNQVWKTDITYIKIRHGFIYLICIIDVFSRRVMGWSVSTSLNTKHCLEAYEMACKTYGNPDILNSDQGCQFTSDMWVNRIVQSGVKISMDGKGRWADNIIIERFWRSIKYELVFLACFETVADITKSIKEYIEFYNNERPHQALKYQTPNEVFFDVNSHADNDVQLSVVLGTSTKYANVMAKNSTQQMGGVMGV